ncbi:hypothetical protein GQ53DRAFT_826230 [Thozetella sp. PMI_491]|nr:hypothetical protein GQ53DRAFT_826230 [Thozetella sp. PMI_491]
MRSFYPFILLVRILEARSTRNSPRPGDDPVNDETYCIEESFSEPRWYLYSSRYSETSIENGVRRGTVGFNAQNIPTGLSFDCLAKNVSLAATGNETVWHDCDNPKAQFKFDLVSEVISMRESWTCGNSSTVFSGHGSTPIPIAQGCGQENNFTFCVYADTGVSVALSMPVEIVPMLPGDETPPYELAPNCAERSSYPTWEVADLSYKLAGSGSSLSVNMTNLSNGQNVSCNVKVNETLLQKTFHQASWVQCDGKHGGNSTDISGTAVLFDRTYNLLGIRQNWKCPALNSQLSTQDAYVGFGTWVLSNLRCSDTALSVSGSGVCTIPATNFTGFASYNTPSILPHTTYTHSCTMNSLNETYMTLKQYSDHKPNASFTIYNPGSLDEYEIDGLSLTADSHWHQCDPSVGSLPWQLLSCEYSLDRSANQIGFRLRWACDDRDPYRPVLFNATMSGALSAGARLNITDLRWVSTDQRMERGPSLPWI